MFSSVRGVLVSSFKNPVWRKTFCNASNEEIAASKASRVGPTIFDKIISKELKADIIFEDDKCMAFHDVAPQAPVHFLVIPKKPVAKLDECTEHDAQVIVRAIF